MRAPTRALLQAASLTCSPPLSRSIDSLQAIVQRDEGGRGISPLTRPGQLLSVATELFIAAASATTQGKNVLVLTGFPCMRERTPPAETDGPPGAAAVAHTLAALGVPVRLPIEAHSEAVLHQCIEAAQPLAAAASVTPAPLVEAFPAADGWGAPDDARLVEMRASATVVVCLERAGQASDGVCRTMRGLPMGESLVAHQLNELAVTALEQGEAAAPGQMRCVAIGDGGNELGLGGLHPLIVEHVANGAEIGCVVPAHAVLVASVSNWGGYALCHALSLLAWEQGWHASAPSSAEPSKEPPPSADDFLARLAPDRAAVSRAILAANTVGAVDGISAQAGGAVDGMPLEEQCRVVEELRLTCLAHMQQNPFGGGQDLS